MNAIPQNDALETWHLKLREIREQSERTDKLARSLKFKFSSAKPELQTEAAWEEWSRTAKMLNVTMLISHQNEILKLTAPILNNLAGALVHKEIGVESVSGVRKGPIELSDGSWCYSWCVRYS